MFDPPLGAFLACAESVIGQTYPHWQWCLVDDCSTRPEVLDALQALAARDDRIVVHRRAQNGGIVAASNDALERANGDFVVLLDHDDAIVPTALETVVAALDSAVGAEVDYLYTDETHVLVDGRESVHFLKPDWSPERFRSSMYTCHLSVLRRTVVDEVGRFRHGFRRFAGPRSDAARHRTHRCQRASRAAPAHDDLSLAQHPQLGVARRAAACRARSRTDGGPCNSNAIGWASTPPSSTARSPGTYRVVRRPTARTSVTVVVPTRGDEVSRRPFRFAAAPTVRAITASVERSGGCAHVDRDDGLDVRLVVSRPESLGTELVGAARPRTDPDWNVASVGGPWSIANAIDRAVLMCPADVVVIVAPGMVPRDDVTPDWLGALVGLATSNGAGAVGALIADRSDVVLHAGWDIPNYRWYDLDGLKVGNPTAGNDLLIERECTQVSLAAAAVTGAHWAEFGHRAGGGWHDAGRGLSQALVDGGARTLWTPYARFDREVAIDL